MYHLLWLAPLLLVGAYLLARFLCAFAYTSEREVAIEICGDIARYDAMTPQAIVGEQLREVREKIASEERWNRLLFEEAGTTDFLVVCPTAFPEEAPMVHNDLFDARAESTQRLSRLQNEERRLMTLQAAPDSIKAELMRALNERLATVRLWEERLRYAALLLRSRRARSLTIV